MKSTSYLALAAAAGLFAGAHSLTPAQAADLGGDCCADLEERVAELEATTVRKGNRVVSLQLYGQVNKALLVWDDGVDSDAYVVDGDYSGSRMGARGTATIKPGWTAGYLVEWEFQNSGSNVVSQAFDGAALNGDDDNGFINQSIDIFRLRKANVYVESDQFGRLTIGQASAATDGIAEITLGNTFADGFGYYNSGFFVRTDDGGFTDVTWGDIATDVDGPRADVIRYDSPSLYGFVLSASWGENDFWDVALRFAKEWNSVRVAAGIGYAENQEQNVNIFPGNPDQIEGLSGSISVLHTPSGIFGSFMAGRQSTDEVYSSLLGCPDEDDELSAGGDYCLFDAGVELSNFKEAFEDPDDATFYYGQLGIEKNWTGYGASTIYVDYGVYEDFGVGRWYDLGLAGDPLFDFGTGDPVADDLLVSSEVTRYGIGFAQKIDSAAMDLYAVAQWYEADLKGADTFLEEGEVFVDEETEKIDTEDWFSVIMGSRIQF
ncbi:MAG: porin [Dichotomicrobium sp.]